MQHRDRLHKADKNRSNTEIQRIVTKLFKNLFFFTTIVLKVSGINCFAVRTAYACTIATSPGTFKPCFLQGHRSDEQSLWQLQRNTERRDGDTSDLSEYIVHNSPFRKI